MEEVNITIIGAGVIGLAIAAELSAQYDKIVVLEKHSTFGQEISSRNSEVIHAGIYYLKGSLKARLCISGAAQLYEICKEHSIPHKRVGKLIVATEQKELGTLEDLFKKGKENGVAELELLDANDVKNIEPHTNAVSAIYSPNTGIIDSHALMKHLLNKAESNEVLMAFNSTVLHVDRENDAFVVRVKEDDCRLKSRVVINAAGLAATHVAQLAGIDTRARGYTLKLCKGSYFSYTKPSPVTMLVYPVPHQSLTGLGVHSTRDLGGRLRFGPDTEYVDDIEYHVDANKADTFFNAASKIIPNLDRNAFIPDMAGIRPKLYSENEPVRDFVISDEGGGLIDLVGIESPGLTASTAIAKEVSRIIKEAGYL